MIMARVAVLVLALLMPATAYPCAHLQTGDFTAARNDWMAWYCLAQEIFPPSIDVLVTNGNCTKEQFSMNVWPCDDAQCDSALKSFYKAGIGKCFASYPGYAALFKCAIDNYCGDGSRRLQIQDTALFAMDGSLFPLKRIFV
mmetsp:Transcript_130393/g.230420  ORF Transcript_130393/g.230420 Transcript_130393/m.230420 type:complete len:142 (-) Transcript_130393:343-768(-)